MGAQRGITSKGQVIVVSPSTPARWRKQENIRKINTLL